jgi:hypothetical protein
MVAKGFSVRNDLMSDASGSLSVNERSQDCEDAFQGIIVGFALRRGRFWFWVGSIFLPIFWDMKCIQIPTDTFWFYGCNLFYRGHRRVSANHVAILRGVITGIRT